MKLVEGIKNMVDRQLKQGQHEEKVKYNEVTALFTERARLHAIFHGKVQGVFFRDFAKKNAEQMGLVGYVKNNDNGTVELIVEGDKTKLRELLALCQTKHPIAKVDKVEWVWQEYSGKFSRFVVH